MYPGMPLGELLVSLHRYARPGATWKSVFYVAGMAALAVVPLLILYRIQKFLDVRGVARSPAEFQSALFRQGRAQRQPCFWASLFCTLLVLYLLLNWLPTLLVSRGLSKPDAAKVQLVFNLVGALAPWWRAGP